MDSEMLPNRDRLDRAGVFLSGLCAAHCILGIVLVSLLGLGGGLLLDPAIHETGLVLAIVVGGVSLGLGLRRHGSMGPLLTGVCGLALMALAIAVGHGMGEAVLTIAGVALVAAAHIRNLHKAS